MKAFPMVAAFIGGMVGWKLGLLVGRFTAIIASLVMGVLAFYYARKYQKEILG